MQRVFGRPPLYERTQEATPQRTAREEAEIARRLPDQVDALTEHEQTKTARKRLGLRLTLRETWTDPSSTTIQTNPQTPVRRRVTSLLAYCANTSTLNIGPLGAPWLVLPLAAGLTALPGLGDETTGGLILEPADIAQLVNSGSAGRMTLALFGDLIPESQEL